MLKRRYEVLLPLSHNDGRPVDDALFEQSREEVIARFAAISILPGSIAGVWVHAGTRYSDDLVRLSVDAENTPEARQFFVDWKPTLLQRFEQIDIYIVSFEIDVI